jgi:hypothetical protein
VRLEGLDKFKISPLSSLEPATFRLVAYRLNYRVPPVNLLARPMLGIVGHGCVLQQQFAPELVVDICAHPSGTRELTYLTSKMPSISLNVPDINKKEGL